jgi:hypothetical protein
MIPSSDLPRHNQLEKKIGLKNRKIERKLLLSEASPV